MYMCAFCSPTTKQIRKIPIRQLSWSFINASATVKIQIFNY